MWPANIQNLAQEQRLACNCGSDSSRSHNIPATCNTTLIAKARAESALGVEQRALRVRRRQVGVQALQVFAARA